MKNNVTDIKKKIANREEEKKMIRSQIEEISAKIDKAEVDKERALASGDNASFLSKYREAESLKIDKSGLETLLKEKNSLPVSPEEILDAWKQSEKEFEAARKTEVEKYHKAKKKLAEMYIELLKKEIAVSKEREYCSSLLNYSPMDTRLPFVQSVENDKRTTNLFFDSDYAELGIQRIEDLYR